MARSKIEWTDATWNPVTGCTKVSAGCTNCYAERMAGRRMGAEWRQPFREYLRGKPGAALEEYIERPRRFSDVICHPERLDEPLHWRKPRRVFVCSMSDLFHPDVPDGFIFRVWQTMAATPWHTYQVLTKRPERMAEWVGVRSGGFIMPPFALPNVWLGTSVENQAAADLRIPHLLRCPAAVRFVSYEPALGPVVLHGWDGKLQRNYLTDQTGSGIDWLIAGGESGPKARPAHPDWFRSVRDQCAAAGVPFFFKQRGEWSWEEPDPDDETSPLFPLDWAARPERYRFLLPDGSTGTGYGGDRGVFVARVGKRAAGHMLDGREHREWPVDPQLHERREWPKGDDNDGE